MQSRRRFLVHGLGVAATAALLPHRVAIGQPGPGSGLKLCLTPGSIGVRANQREAMDLAVRHGFDAVEPFGGYLASLTSDQLQELLAELKSKKLVWGAAGLPVEFRRGDEQFSESIAGLPRIAAALQAAGVKRVGTWLSPADSSLTYLTNFKRHVNRLGQAARVLKDHDLRLGLEYVGTQSSRRNRKFSFIHTLAETQDLIAGIGTGNVGLVVDSWHWWQAGDTADDIRSLRAEDVISVDLNDAPAGIAKEEQRDGQRELPGATGVIDAKSFLGALDDIGYTGPARAEPFNETLNQMDNDQACAATISAMKNLVGRS